MDLATMPGALRPATGSPAARPRKLRRGPLTRKQILDASLKLFSDKGFVRTSVRDIAQAAGITDAAIYYHFASKRDLFEALIEERGFTAVLEQLERAEITDGPEIVIPRIACSALEFLYQNRDLLKVLLVEALAEDPVAAEEYRILVERWERAEARILKYYAAQGMLRTAVIDTLAKQLVVTVLGAFADYLMSPSDSPKPSAPPHELMEQVEISSQNIVQGIT
jgi:AcrR family transcriptional regulator